MWCADIRISGRFLNLLFSILFFAGSLSAQTRLAPPNDPAPYIRPGQAEIIINAANSDRDIAVWINGIMAAHVPPNLSEKIVVRNGQNLIEAADTTLSRGQWKIGNKKKLTVNSNNDCITIGMGIRYGALLNLNIINTVPLVRVAEPIEDAINRTADKMIEGIPNGATVAVLSISSSDSDQAQFIISQLAFLLVSSRKFKVVDRQDLDAVREEVKFQYSGDVDDDSAVSIGKNLGASIVITGRVIGSGASKFLSTQALDVETIEIVAVASERY